MDTELQQKFRFLSSQSEIEVSEDAFCPQSPSGKTDTHLGKAVLPNGKVIALAKTLLSSACERNCYYCPFRAGRDMRRETFRPSQLATIVNDLYHKKVIDGIFLSSGIVGGGIRTQDLLIDTAEQLRHKFNYRGYLHLKIMPGSEYDQVFRTMQLADRVSLNLEGPNEARLKELAPHKSFFGELLQPLQWVEDIRKNHPDYSGWNKRWPSSTTQFVVGGAGENDEELLRATEYLYRNLKLSRTYFSSFTPVPNTPLDYLPASSPERQNRLYQASFMLRDYGFQLDEIPLDEHGYLSHHIDPKLAWAQRHLVENPIEINKAGISELIRIPGIGRGSAKAILKARPIHKLRNLDDLRQIGIRANRSLPFILLDGWRPEIQLSFPITY